MTECHINNLISKYHRKGVFVDTNLLLVWLVGLLDKEMIPHFKRTDKFVPEDFNAMDWFIGRFAKRITSPNVLTEVSNLAGKVMGRKAEFFRDVFAPSILKMFEVHLPSGKVAIRSEFAKFGLTDCVIIEGVKKYLLLTDDLDLFLHFQTIGGDAINFNHIRTANWKSN